VFEGEFLNGEVLRGTAHLPNGTVVAGEWGDVNCGTITYADGRMYKGQWNGNPLPGKEHKPGSWTEERPHGRGKMTYPDGTVKEGLWEEGVFVGDVAKEGS
jgi:hypothetical protein